MKKLLTMLTAVCLAMSLAAGAAGESPAAAGDETLAGAVSAAEGAVTENKALQLGASNVSYPAITGMADGELQAQVNGQILEDLQVKEYLDRMTALISDEAHGIDVRWDGAVYGDVCSGLLEAEGSLKNLRRSHAWTWSNIDLRDGHEITFGELFTEEDAAREWLEGYLEETVAPTLSAHLAGSAVTPLPEGFRLEPTGLTLLYPADQLCTLKERAGAVKIAWNEIRELADWSEDGIPARIGAAEMTEWTEESPERIREMAESGQLPGIPVMIGDGVKDWTDRMDLLNDPEEYAGGRMFELEGAAFRNVYLLSDAVSRGWEDSEVSGIRMDRGCAWGLCIGETQAAVWRDALGEPEDTAVFDADKAESYRTVPGTCDYYEFGEYRLQLQADGDGVLVSITLAK